LCNGVLIQFCTNDDLDHFPRLVAVRG
jgi:hypothetical protein